jgi:hypothetical protein
VIGPDISALTKADGVVPSIADGKIGPQQKTVVDAYVRNVAREFSPGLSIDFSTKGLRSFAQPGRARRPSPREA